MSLPSRPDSSSDPNSLGRSRKKGQRAHSLGIIFVGSGWTASALCSGCSRLFASLGGKLQNLEEPWPVSSCDIIYLAKYNLLPYWVTGQPKGTVTRKEIVESPCFLLSPKCPRPFLSQGTWPTSKFTVHPSLFGAAGDLASLLKAYLPL